MMPFRGRLPSAACAVLAAVLVWAPGPAARADDVPPATEEAKRDAIRDIRKDLRRWAGGPRAAKHKEDILRALDALDALGGWRAARGALDAVAFADADVRTRAFALIEKEHDPELVRPLLDLLEEKDHRRDFDLHKRVAHALAVVGDTKAIEPLTELVRSEDAHVVAAVSDALATFASAPNRMRKDPVKRLIEVYNSTWTLMNSVRPEHAVISKVMREKYDVYGKSVRAALQALTGQQDLSRPHEWTRWWNDHKKRMDW